MKNQIIGQPNYTDCMNQQSPYMSNKIDRKTVHILVAEDNDFYRNIIIRHLKFEGYGDISGVLNGREALEIIESKLIDVILLDINMPELNGFEVLKRLKNNKNYRDIPVIMISADEELESVVKCIELGAEDYLPKPVNSTLLKARLGACIEKKKWHDQELVYLEEIEEERQKVDELLKITLPAAAVRELKDKGFIQPQRFDDVAVLFCDVIDFTDFCNSLSPEEIVEQITRLIEGLEKITREHGMEKIKTIGDEFMATAGLLEVNDQPLISAINCGLAMSDIAPTLVPGWEVRVGIAQGPVVAGIVGHQKYQFDVWGDTVNLAARMTRFGKPGVIALTRKTWEKVKDQFPGDFLGQFDVKGMGVIDIMQCRHNQKYLNSN